MCPKKEIDRKLFEEIMTSSVQIVFCMDTEGPCADPNNAELLANWELVNKAMDKLFTPEFRNKYPDTDGSHFKIGWFFLTWTGFKTNPRGRDMGYHKIRDHYMARWGDLLTQYGDEHCWHYHHPPASGIGNEWGLDWTICREFEQIISRQILEREWFPTCYRAGATIMDPMSSRWVDSWFPFDYSNRAPLSLPGLVDWSSGVAKWELYHPDTEDFRKPGAGRRRMARCLDLVTNVSMFSDQDIEAAFTQAQNGQNAILSFFDHDYRDIADRIHSFLNRVQSVAHSYPDVSWQYAGPVEAIYQYLSVNPPPSLEIDVTYIDNAVHIKTTHPLFQSIPWIAVKTGSGTLIQQQKDVLREDAQHWVWRPEKNLEWTEVGIGGSTEMGASATAKLQKKDAPTPSVIKRSFTTHPKHPHSIWEYSKYYLELCIARASGKAEEMDSIKQAVELLKPHLQAGMSVLDVGCAAGHAWHSLRNYSIEYFGIDTSERAINIGRDYLPKTGLKANHLRALSIEDLPPQESYDTVMCLNVLSYLPMYHLPLEVLARATNKWLVIRSGFDTETQIRFLPDVWLEPGFQTLRTYFNIYSKNEIETMLRSEGFKVFWHRDRRQLEKFNGQPETIGGLSLPAEFLFAERIAPRPSASSIWGPKFSALANQWLRDRQEPNDDIR